MILANCNYDLDNTKKRLNSHQNSYMDLLAADITRSNISCTNHFGYPDAIVELGVVENEKEGKLVDVIGISKACCKEFSDSLYERLKKELKF